MFVYYAIIKFEFNFKEKNMKLLIGSIAVLVGLIIFCASILGKTEPIDTLFAAGLMITGGLLMYSDKHSNTRRT